MSELKNSQLLMATSIAKNAPVQFLMGDIVEHPNQIELKIARSKDIPKKDYQGFINEQLNYFKNKEIVIRYRGNESLDTYKSSPVFNTRLSSTVIFDGYIQVIFTGLVRYTPKSEYSYQSIDDPDIKELIDPSFLLGAARKPACDNCVDYLGEQFGDHLLICGMHASGPEDPEYCMDHSSRRVL